MSIILLNFWSLQFQSKTRKFKGFKLRPPERYREKVGAIKTEWHKLIKMTFYSPGWFSPHLLSFPLVTHICILNAALAWWKTNAALRLAFLIISSLVLREAETLLAKLGKRSSAGKESLPGSISRSPRSWSSIPDRNSFDKVPVVWGSGPSEELNPA